MCKDYSNEVIALIEDFKDRGFEWGKDLKLLCFQSNLSKTEMIQEILNHKNLYFTQKQDHDEEIRYTLYFVYNKSRCRFYVITFRSKIRVITVHVIGRRTLRRYFKKRFKKNGYLD